MRKKDIQKMRMGIKNLMEYKKQRIEQLLVPHKEGYCRICSKLRDLSADHVPPKCVGNNVSVNIRIANSVKKLQGGAKFRTICTECNNMLGRNYDVEFKKLYDEMQYLKKKKYIDFKYAGVTVNPIKLLRSICGHLLAIYFGDDIEAQIVKEPDEIDMLEKFRKFVLGEIEVLDHFTFYYWYYPYDEVEITQYWGMLVDVLHDPSLKVFGTTFKTFPIGIWIVSKENSTVFPRFREIPQINQEVKLKFNVTNILPKEKPEMPDKKGVTMLSLDSMIRIDKGK